ncbi:hypothetical protein [Elioraea rosea]|uniref:hypothetical protein n=1 Tax=Elioraea rosea TaxID=2492390 RepID=UPI00118609E2|nr:hypothetical protein [Elioraea rosea]
MAETSLIATTEAAGLRPLAVGGQGVTGAAWQIAAHLRRARGPDHAALFAEPTADAARGIIDWYAPGEGDAVPLASLEPGARAEAEARLASLFADISAEATALKASPREGDKLLGELLSLAMRVPDPSYIRVRNGRPVLVAWGHEAGGRSVGPELLDKPADLPPLRRPILFPRRTEAAAARAWPWLLLASLLALLLLLLLLLFWRNPFGWFAMAPPGCSVEPAGIALLEEQREGADRFVHLQEDLARARRALGDARLACPPVRRQAEAPPPPPRNEDAERARREGGREGQVQVILAWDDRNDLDLAIVCPDGQRIYFENRRACGAELDVDMNVEGGPRAVSNRPVENVTWPSTPANGRYRIEVTNYSRASGGPATSPFRVTIRRPGQPDQVLRGNAAVGQTVRVGEFSVP